MALLLDDIFQECKHTLVTKLNAECGNSADALFDMYLKCKDDNDPSVYDINNSANLVTLINLHGLTAADIAKLVQSGATYVSRNEMTGAIETTTADGLRAKVMNKAGKQLAELIRNPQSNIELYNECVGRILAPYFETLVSQNK